MANFAGGEGLSNAQAGGMGAGFILQAMGGINQAFEQQREFNAERNILTNNSALVLAARDAQIRDTNTRARIMSGRTYAIAGHSGVAGSGSVVNAAADLMGKAAIDKLRIEIQAQNQVTLNAYKSAELARQGKKGVSDAISNAFIGSIATVGMMLV